MLPALLCAKQQRATLLIILSASRHTGKSSNNSLAPLFSSQRGRKRQEKPRLTMFATTLKYFNWLLKAVMSFIYFKENGSSTIINSEIFINYFYKPRG